MKIKDSIKFALDSLTSKSLRSWLTILGVVIGVSTIIAIISVGQGMQDAVESQLNSLGNDVIQIIPGVESGMASSIMPGAIAKEAGDLTDDDVKNIKTVEGVLYVSPQILGMVKIKYSNEESNTQVQGIDENWKYVTTKELETGRFLTSNDKGVALVGSMLAKDRFEKPILIGSQIKIEDKPFKVIGILKESGGTKGMIEDNMIFISLDDAGEYALLGKDKYSTIEVKADKEKIEEIAVKIEEKLMLTRGVTEKTRDFNVFSPKTLASVASNITGIISLFLGGIAAISLLVGAIGIANTMFTSVTERTRQIGILKAIGCSNKEVTKLFLIEAAIIGLIGGILGIFLGFIVSGVIGEIGIAFLPKGGMIGRSLVSIKPWLIVFALAFSILIGIVSGILPARRAANLQPVEALRYE